MCCQTSPERDPDSEGDETAPSDALSRTETDLELMSCLSSSTSSKQSRQFNPDWLLERQHWLEYAGGQGMFCTPCRKYNNRPFNRDIWNTQPCTRLRLQSVIYHEHSAAHIDRVQREAAAASTENIVEALHPPVPANGMEQAFLCLHFLVKQDSTYNQLQTVNGPSWSSWC